MGGVKARKALKRLKRRQAAFDAHGPDSRMNPGKQEGGGMRMHRPGSNKK